MKPKSGTAIFLFVIAMAVAAATIAGTYFGVPQLAFLAADSSGLLVISGTILVGAVIALINPEVFKWIFSLAAVAILLAAAYGVFVSENSDHRVLGGGVLAISVLVLFGSLLQWNNSRMDESPQHQNILGMYFVVGMVAGLGGFLANSFAVGIGIFIVISVAIIFVTIMARRSNR